MKIFNMKIKPVKCLIVVVFMLAGFSFKSFQKTETNKTKVAVLGLFHFAGSSSDLASIKLEDPLGEKRQHEIIELVSLLKEYQPTKILVEYPKKRNAELNQRLSKYLDGDYELGVSEIYQVGFRLVEQLELQEIYAIDHKLDLPTKDIVVYAQQNNQMEKFNGFISKIKTMMQNETKKLDTTNISDYLAYMNSDSNDRLANEVYLKDMLAFGDAESEVGIAASSIWWKRNMYILKNIRETIENDDDRILVIIGAAHRAILKDFIEDLGDLEYVEIGELMASR